MYKEGRADYGRDSLRCGLARGFVDRRFAPSTSLVDFGTNPGHSVLVAVAFASVAFCRLRVFDRYGFRVQLPWKRCLSL